MMTLFNGDVAEVPTAEKTTTIEINSVCTARVMAGVHLSAKCPFCHKVSEVLVYNDNGYSSLEACVHLDGLGFHRSSRRVTALKFTGKRRQVAIPKAEVEHIYMAIVGCPHCGHDETIPESDIPGSNAIWKCDSCGKESLI